ncbi:3'-5' exonuclease [Bacteriovoracaceae bacterium]|nr:3'-5' exonuclease [Bacteriovoracaceae bacterium]
MTIIEADISKNLDSLNLLETLTFCVIDLETTGGNQSKDKIIEFGLVKIKKLEIVEEKNILVDPEIPIPEFIQKLTSIKDKDVMGCPKIEDIIDDVVEFMGDAILVAHNISFDIPFLNSVLRRLDKPELKNKVICTNVMTKYLIPEIMNSNLNYLCQLFDIEHDKAHRAEDDAKATAEILLKYIQIYIEKGIKKVNQLYYPKNKFELDRINYSKNDKENGATVEEIIQIIKNSPTPMTIAIKGEKGVMQAVVPLQKCSKEYPFVEQLLDKLNWEVVTLKLMGPILEGFLQLSLHFNKFEEDIKNEIASYLYNIHGANDETQVDRNFLNKLDFVITPHLIKDQLICYSFLNLSNSTKLVFKYPGHKKKFIQYANNQKKRFQTYQKEKKRLNVHKELIPLINNMLYAESKNKKSHYTFIKMEKLKNPEAHLFDMIDNFSKQKGNLYQYPKKHL